MKSDAVINVMSGATVKVEGERIAWRLLRIFRRQTRNPFADKVDRRRLLMRPGITFTKIRSEMEKQLFALIDQGKIVFKVEMFRELRDLEKYIETRSVEYVKQRVKQTYMDQGGQLLDGLIDFSQWYVQSHTNISDINIINYKFVFFQLNSIKFIKK